MSWLAHLVGGPKHGQMEFAYGHWPILGFRDDHPFIYRLRCWVERNGQVVPGTPLVYAWEGYSEAEAIAAIDAYLKLHTQPGGILAGFTFTRLSVVGRLPGRPTPSDNPPGSTANGKASPTDPADD